VRDAEGSPRSVAVEFTSPASKQRNSILSGADGVYKITDLPPGRYSLKFTLVHSYDAKAARASGWSGRGRIGTDCATRDKVLVRAGRHTTVDVVLKHCSGYIIEIIRPPLDREHPTTEQ
jgi:hypothetical protein